MKKQLTLGLIALGLASGSALAGTPAKNVLLPKAHNILVTVPEQNGHWDFGLEFLLWQPTNSDLQYAVQRSEQQGAGSSFSHNYFRTKEVSGDHEWGFRLDGTYHMPTQGKDIEMDWVHFTDGRVHKTSDVGRLGDGDSFAVNIPWDYLAPTLTETQPFDYVHAVQEYDYDHFDAIFGQKMRVGHRVVLHPYAGARFIDIHGKNNIAAVFSDTPNVTERWRFRTSYEGIGPRVGMDGDIKLGHHVGAFVRGGVSLLVGEQGFNYLQDNTDSTNNQNIQKHEVNDIVRVVPEADIKVGVHYGFNLNHQMNMNIELGFQAENYFDILNKSYLASFDSANGSTNFGWNGPYARLQLNLA